MTVQEVLKSSGFSDSQIAQLDARAMNAFGNVLSQAEQERAQTALERKSLNDFYENSVVAGLTQWESDRDVLEAAKTKAEREAAYFRAAAREAGILPGEDASRDRQGRFVAGSPGATPGSPTFSSPSDAMATAARGLAQLADVDWRHRNLYGSPLPISPSELVSQADAVGVDPATFAARKFKFAEREQELERKRQQEHDEKIRRDALAENDRKWAEKMGSNPDSRQSLGTSKFGEIRRGMAEGKVVDPTKLSDAARRQVTRQAIHREISEREATDA